MLSSGDSMLGRPELKIDQEEFATMYDNKVPTADIARHFGISLFTVRKIRIRLNIPINRGRFDKTEYRRLFFEGVSYPEMSKQLGLSRWAIMEIRKQLNLPARKRGIKRVRNVR
jgi:hypothetical protein